MRQASLIILLFCLLAGQKGFAQETAKVDSSYLGGHYTMRLDFYRKMPNQKKEIVFLGNSITEVGEWQELLPGLPVVNRGISGDVSWGVLARLDEVLASKPAKIFIAIGVNDIKRGTPTSYIVHNYRRMLQRIQQESPKTKVYLQSILPVNEPMLAAIYKNITNARIQELNTQLQALAQGQKNVRYVNIHPALVDSTGQLDKDLSTDGLHLKLVAYIKWVEQLKKEKAL
ncbi:GDSL family lipase [Nibribacter ruber]|uniref:GDSL family lipase n=2 Tax=Nibribacter ruber TaxID=2698458 RepID=A0A6P1P4Y2_9BACT|nr:GDSL family lipase [Nibribacter ruber]